MLCWNKEEIPGHLKFQTEPWFKRHAGCVSLRSQTRKTRQQNNFSGEGKMLPTSTHLHIQICFLDWALHISPLYKLGPVTVKSLLALQHPGSFRERGSCIAVCIASSAALRDSKVRKQSSARSITSTSVFSAGRRQVPPSTDTVRTSSQLLSAIQSQ